MKKNISTSLLISTYNWPQALSVCLESVLLQKVLPCEVIVADDGSSDSTLTVVKEYQQKFPVPLIHIWQKDEGFQLAKIRNRAIAMATSDYIVQIDGDLILHPYFIADHIKVARKNLFVSGSRVILGAQLSAELLSKNSTTVSLLELDVDNRLNSLRIPIFRDYMSHRYKKKDKLYLRGCNMSFWRNDLLKVNGYNEEFRSWGLEDNEIAVRLINSGINKQSLKFGGIVYHLFHEEQTGEVANKNIELLKASINNNLTRCENGLDKYLS